MTLSTTNSQGMLVKFSTLVFIFFSTFSFADSITEKQNKGDLSDEQKNLLSEMECYYQDYQKADCDKEELYREFHSDAKLAFSASMAPPPTIVEECCIPGGSENDAEEDSGGGNFNNTDNILGIGYTAGNTNSQTVAARFDCYNIPQGAVIISASMQFTAAAPSVRGAAFTIVGEDADNCAPFNAGTPISGRTGTTASVPWSPPTWVAAGDALAAQQTPDLTSIVQEIVNRPGYAAGNALCFGISGKGLREAFSFDSGQGEPELCIEYEVPEEISTCTECPNVSLSSLDGVPGFAEVNLLNVCSDPDTVSLLIYNTGECDLTNVQLALNFDSGLTYGGCIKEHYGGPVTADEFDVSNPSQPIFLITQIDSAQAFIVDICIKSRL